ncbi:MAG: glycerate dehydrogenase [Granulosicoccus sp.]|jgi:glycerate dehydrogenase
MKIVFLDRDTMGPNIELTRPNFEHEWAEYERTAADEVANRIKGADIVITNKAPIRSSALSEQGDLKMISVAATGYDVIDVETCRTMGIQVSNVRGYAKNTVPEHTFALILGLRRSIKAYVDDVIAGEWQRSGQFCFFNHPISDLAGSRLGIIGAGSIGQSVASIARAFGMEPVFAARKGATEYGHLYRSWNEVIETSDILTIHAPLTTETRHSISQDEFNRMKNKPLIINTARGGFVDEEALVVALNAGLISGFGFDVLTTEPPENSNPLLTVQHQPNVLLTPHIAWASQQARQEVWRQTTAHIEGFVNGQVLNAVT